MALSLMVSIIVRTMLNMALGNTKKSVIAANLSRACFSARDFLNIDMANSVMVGDKAEDMMAAEAAGVGTKILVRTGKPITEQGEALATVVLDSIRDVPHYLLRVKK